MRQTRQPPVAPRSGLPARSRTDPYNTRQFDRTDDLFTPGFFSHPLGITVFEAGKDAWRKLTARFPGVRVVAEDILRRVM